MKLALSFLFVIAGGLGSLAASEEGHLKGGSSAPLQSEQAPLQVTIQNHVFTPNRIELSANQRTEIRVKNLDATAEEFESPGLRVEKVIPAKSELVVRIMPIAAGNYTFIGEYHEKTARGLAVVK